MRINQMIKVSIAGLLLSTATLATTSVQSVLNMNVSSDGIYRVNYSDVLSQGVNLSGIGLSNLSITNNGNAIPIKIVSDNQSTFGVNSYIEFVGLAGNNIYQQGNVYTLVFANPNTSVIVDSSVVPKIGSQTQSHYLQTDIYAENNEYSYGAPNEDPWYTKRLFTVGAELTDLNTFNVDNLVNSGEVKIEMNIWGGLDYLQTPDHHVTYSLNGEKLETFSFDGVTSDIREYPIAANTISNGVQNLTIKLANPNDTGTAVDIIHVESLKVTYPRDFVLTSKLLDFNVFETSQKVSGLADQIFQNGFENSLKNYAVKNANDEDYSVYQLNENGSVISIDSLKSGSCASNISITCSINFSLDNSSGRVFIAAQSEMKLPELSLPVIIEDINTGVFDYLIISHPDFIGDELADFVELKQLEYTVKVVDIEQIYSQYGYGNISAQSIADYIKDAANLMAVKNVLLVGGDVYDYKNHLGLGVVSFIPTLYGQTDELISFAPIDAKYGDINGDNVPDINIGRFPVRTVQELANLTIKITNYTNKTYSNTSLFAADKFDASNGYSFKGDAEFLISTLPQVWQSNISNINKAYVDDDGVANSKLKISDGINQGVALTSFVGHSGPRDWSFSRMFSASDASLLTNVDRPTLVTQWGCWNTYFVSPTEDTLAHAFMLNENGGAASVLGASTLTKAEHEKELAQRVLTNLTHNNMSLGDAVTTAKQDYALINPDALDVILGWTILGDPGLKL